MGEDGEVWDTARLATSSEKRLKQLYQFASFRRHIENLVVTAQRKVEADPMALAAAVISKLRNGAGAGHFERLVRHAMEAYDFKAKKWKPRKIRAGNISFNKFRVRLSRHYLDKGRAFILETWKDDLPDLTRLTDESGTHEIGALADIIQVAKCAAASALGREKYQEHFTLKELPALATDHVWLLCGAGDDGVPFRTIQIDEMDQGSLSISNLGGAAHAPENMWAFFLASCSETSTAAKQAHEAQEKAFDWMKASDSADPSKGIPIVIRSMPPNARYEHSGTVGEPHTVYVHWSLGHLLHADGKSQSGAFDRSFAAAAMENGCLRVHGLSRDNAVRPDVPITDNSEDVFHWMTAESCASQAQAVRDHNATLPRSLSESARHASVRQFCLDNGNMFSRGEVPFRYALVGFMDNLHSDMLEGELSVKQEDDFCDEHAGADEYHALLINSGSYGLKKKGTALRNAHNGETEGIKSRMMGDDVIDHWQLFADICDLMLRLAADNEHSQWTALGILARMHMHRCMSSMYSRHTMPVEFIDLLVAMGNDVQRLLFHTVQHATFTTAYWTKVNPQLLKRLRADIQISADKCWGLGSLASCQGFERLHAWLKLMFRLITHGRHGSHHDYLQDRFIFQIAGENGDFDCPSQYRPDRRHRFADENGWSASNSTHHKRGPTDSSTGDKQCATCNRKCDSVASLSAHALDPPHFKCYRFSEGEICVVCTRLANFIREACAHGKQPTGDYGAYIATEENRAQQARSHGRVEASFERELRAATEAPARADGTRGRDMDDDNDDDGVTGADAARGASSGGASGASTSGGATASGGASASGGGGDHENVQGEDEDAEDSEAAAVFTMAANLGLDSDL